jgi:hypothetical protein
MTFGHTLLHTAAMAERFRAQDAQGIAGYPMMCLTAGSGASGSHRRSMPRQSQVPAKPEEPQPRQGGGLSRCRVPSSRPAHSFVLECSLPGNCQGSR